MIKRRHAHAHCTHLDVSVHHAQRVQVRHLRWQWEESGRRRRGGSRQHGSQPARPRVPRRLLVCQRRERAAARTAATHGSRRALTISTMRRKWRAASASLNVPLETMRSKSSPPTHSSMTMCTVALGGSACCAFGGGVCQHGVARQQPGPALQRQQGERPETASTLQHVDAPAPRSSYTLFRPATVACGDTRCRMSTSRLTSSTSCNRREAAVEHARRARLRRAGAPHPR